MESRLKATLAAVLGLNTAALADDASPENIPDWDSVMQMNIILAVEDEFDVRFQDDMIANLASYSLIRDALVSMGIAFP